MPGKIVQIQSTYFYKSVTSVDHRPEHRLYALTDTGELFLRVGRVGGYTDWMQVPPLDVRNAQSPDPTFEPQNSD